MFLEKAEQVYIDYGTTKSRKIFKLSSVDMSDELKSALIGFHAFTGNNYVSSFFKKSKKHCWHLLQNNSRFVWVFAGLGDLWHPSNDLLNALEEVVCYMFGRKQKI